MSTNELSRAGKKNMGWTAATYVVFGAVLVGSYSRTAGAGPDTRDPRGDAVPHQDPSSTPGVSATFTNTATPFQSATAIPSASPTPTQTRSIPATVTSEPGESAIAIDIPPATIAAGAELVADRTAVFGTSGMDEFIALDDTRGAVFVDRRLWIIDFSGPELEVGEGLITDVARDELVALRFIGDTLAMLHGSRVDFIDITDPTAPRMAAHYDLPGEASYVHSAHDISSGTHMVVVANHGDVDTPVWIIRLELESPDRVHFVGELSPAIESLYRVYIDVDYLAMNSVVRADSERRVFWQLFRLDDLPDFTPLMEGEPSAEIRDMEGGRMLTQSVEGLTVYDLRAGPDPVSLGSYEDGRNVGWSQLNGNTVRFQTSCFGPLGSFCGAWIHDVAFPADGPPNRLGSTEIDGGVRWSGPDAYCIYVRKTDDLECTGSAIRPVAVERFRLMAEGDHRSDRPCTSVALYDDMPLLRCSAHYRWLSDPEPGRLAIAEMARLSATSSRGLLSTNGHVVTHVGNRLWDLVRRDGAWSESVAIDGARRAFAEGGWIGIVAESGPSTQVLQVRAARPITSEIRTSMLVNSDVDAVPIVSEEAFYFRRLDSSWERIRLDLEGPLVTDTVFDGSIFESAVVKGEVAYVRSVNVRPDRSEEHIIDAYSLASNPPVLIDSLVLEDRPDVFAPGRPGSLYLAGDILHVDRGERWFSRVDVSIPIAPVLLSPFAFSFDAFALSPFSDGRLASLGLHQLEVVGLSSDKSRTDQVSWNRWHMSKAPTTVETLGDRLYVGQAHPDGLGERDVWIYDLENPSTPRRISHVSTGASRSLGWSAGRLEVVGADGLRLESYEFGESGDAVLKASWCVGDGRCPPTEGAEAFASVVSAPEAVLTLGVSGTLRIFERGPSLDPVASGSWRFDGLDGGTMSLVAGAVLMVASDSGTVRLFDVRTSGTVRPLGVLAGLPGPVDDVLTQGNIALLAIGEELIMIDFSFIEIPTVIANLRFDSPIVDVDVDRSAMVVATEERLWLFDRPSSSTVTALGSIAQAGVIDVAIQDWTLYISKTGQGEIEVLQNVRFGPFEGEPIWLPSVVR